MSRFIFIYINLIIFHTILTHSSFEWVQMLGLYSNHPSAFRQSEYMDQGSHLIITSMQFRCVILVVEDYILYIGNFTSIFN